MAKEQRELEGLEKKINDEVLVGIHYIEKDEGTAAANSETGAAKSEPGAAESESTASNSESLAAKSESGANDVFPADPANKTVGSPEGAEKEIAAPAFRFVVGEAKPGTPHDPRFTTLGGRAPRALSVGCS